MSPHVKTVLYSTILAVCAIVPTVILTIGLWRNVTTMP